MQELQFLVPNSNRQLWQFDDHVRLSNLYLEGPCVDVAQRYLSQFYGHGPQVREIARISEVVRRHDGTAVADAMQRFSQVQRSEWLRSDFHNVIMAPAGMIQGVNVMLGGGPNPATLCLWRTAREPSFNRRDYALLEALSGFVAHGLRPGPDPQGDSFVDTEDRALIIADVKGRMQHLSTQARRLLLLALVPRWATATVEQMRLDNPPEIAWLCRTLAAAFSGRLPAAPPLLRRRNAWGEFVLRGYWFGAHGGDVSPFVGITIERREPRVLALQRRIESLPLSDREKQFCLLVVRGHDTADAARAMGISEHTAIAHRRSIYAKLGVSNLAALFERLETA